MSSSFEPPTDWLLSREEDIEVRVWAYDDRGTFGFGIGAYGEGADLREGLRAIRVIFPTREHQARNWPFVLDRTVSWAELLAAGEDGVTLEGAIGEGWRGVAVLRRVGDQSRFRVTMTDPDAQLDLTVSELNWEQAGHVTPTPFEVGLTVEAGDEVAEAELSFEPV